MDMTWYDELEARIPKGERSHPVRTVAHRLHACGQSSHRLIHLADRPQSPRQPLSSVWKTRIRLGKLRAQPNVIYRTMNRVWSDP